jgi:uncharacterized protein YukE
MAPVMIPAAVDAMTYGGGSEIAVKIQGSPETVASTAAQRLQQAEQFMRIIEQLSSANQSLQQAWSGGASEAAVQKIMSSITSFIEIVEAIQEGAALLHLSSALTAMTQTVWNTVMGWVNPTVAHAMTCIYTWEFAEGLATGSVASMNTYVTGVQAALHVVGDTQMMQQVAVLTTIIMDIERLAQGGNAASDASDLIGLYRAGQMGANSLSSSPATSSPQGDPGSGDVLYA